MYSTFIKSNLFKAAAIVAFMAIFCLPLWAAEECTFSSAAIPDNNAAGVTRILSVTETFDKTIQDLNVRLDINHDKRGDLDISLKHVSSGITVKLVERPNAGAGNCAEQDYDETTLDDEATGGSIQEVANCTFNLQKVSYVPAQPLSAFDGIDVNGDWEFIIKDLAAGNTGTFFEGCILWNATEMEVETFTSSKPVPSSGKEFKFTTKITNKGPFKAYNVFYSLQAILTVMGMDLVDIDLSKGSYGINGLPAAAIVLANLGHLEIGESAEIVLTFIAYGGLPFPLLEGPQLYPYEPQSLPSEMHSIPYAWDDLLHMDEISRPVVLVEDGSNDGGAGTFNDACQPLTNAAAVGGNIALIDARSPFGANPFVAPPEFPAAPCAFMTQVNNAVAAGAVGVLLSSAYSDLFSPGPVPPVAGMPVPVLTINKTDHGLLASSVNPKATIKSGFPRIWNTITPITGDFGSFVYNKVALLNRIVGDPDMSLLYLGFDKDMDNTPDVLERCETDPGKTLPGQCGCGVVDSDPDGDGTASCLDLCPNDSDKLSAGICGCGVSDKDSDGDGSVDCNDGCPSDPAKTAAGVCGCGVADVDSNSDGIVDCLTNVSYKALLSEAKTLLSQLTPKKKKTKVIRDQLKALTDQLLSLAEANVNFFSVLSGGDVVKLSKKAKRGIQKSLQAKKSKRLKKAVKKATKSLNNLDAVLA